MKPLLESWKTFYTKETTPISIEHDDSTIDGIIYYKIEPLQNWLNKERIDENTQTKIINMQLPIAVIKNMFVPEESRGQNIGTYLLQDFIEKIGINVPIILIADLGQTQTKGFDLVKWYENKGFNIIGKDSADYPIMIYTP